jgi:hypothetical protein
MGVSSSEEGSIWVTRKTMIIILVPGILKREIPYAAGTANRKETVIEEKAIINEFLMC